MMIPINVEKTSLGFVPLTILGAKIGASTVSAVASAIPNLMKNQAWDNIGGDISELNAYSDQIQAAALQSQQVTNQLIEQAKYNIASNQNSVTNNQVKASQTKTIGLVIFGLLAAGGIYYYTQK